MGFRLFHLLVPLMFVFFVTTANAAADVSESDYITQLPGYVGSLPDFLKFKTGYVGVNKSEVQLFYYFVESERNPLEDPILVWITGGPGCSSLHAFLYQSGPFNFKYGECSGIVPSLFVSPNRWTKYLNIIYLDAPVATGYSYATTPQGYYTTDDQFVANVQEFISTWLDVLHPALKNNELYFGGDGYSGKPIPLLVETILNDTKAETKLNIQGYVLGNPGTNTGGFNTIYEYATRRGFIPEKLFLAVNKTCSGQLFNPSGSACVAEVAVLDKLIGGINRVMIPEPRCADVDPAEQNICPNNTPRRSLQQDGQALTLQADDAPPRQKWCRNVFDYYADVWANNAEVQKALYVRPGKINTWVYCNETIQFDGGSYFKTIVDALDFHKRLIKTNIRGLIYSGFDDLEISYLSTERWIQSLHLKTTWDDEWKAWFVDNETAGYIQSYTNGAFNLTFATINGAGHFANDFRPRECDVLAAGWFARL